MVSPRETTEPLHRSVGVCRLSVGAATCSGHSVAALGICPGLDRLDNPVGRWLPEAVGGQYEAERRV